MARHPELSQVMEQLGPQSKLSSGDVEQLWNATIEKNRVRRTHRPSVSRMRHMIVIAGVIVLTVVTGGFAAQRIDDIFGPDDRAADQVAGLDGDGTSKPSPRLLALIQERPELRASTGDPVVLVQMKDPQIEVVGMKMANGRACFAIASSVIGTVYDCEERFTRERPISTQVLAKGDVALIVGIAADAVTSIDVSSSSSTEASVVLRDGVFYAMLEPVDATREVQIVSTLKDGSTVKSTAWQPAP